MFQALTVLPLSKSARVRAGPEVVIESGKLPVTVIQEPAPPRCTISGCIALLPEDFTAVMDADFAKDIEAAIESHREPLEPPDGTDPRFQRADRAERQSRNARQMLAAIVRTTQTPRSLCSRAIPNEPLFR